MRKIILGLIILGIEVSSVWAGTHYVRANATGTGSGNDWTNAYTNLPSTLVRGDTYFIGNGSYGSYTFDDSGTTPITIKKAIDSARCAAIGQTASECHGPATDWNDSYGNGEALFSGSGGAWTISQGNYVIDGQVGQGKSGYGFRLTMSQFYRTRTINIADNLSNLTLKHLDVSAPGQLSDGTLTCSNNNNDNPSCPINNLIVAVGLSASTIANNFLHGSSWHAAIHTTRWSDVKIENNYFFSTWDKEVIIGWGTPHVDQKITIRNNFFENSQGTGIITWADGGGWKIYNNVFFTTNNKFGATDCTICVVNGHGYVTEDMKIFSNTFVNIQRATGLFFETTTGNEIRNNLFYGPNAIGIRGAEVSDNIDKGTTNPFQAGTNNFHLQTNIPGGALAAEYDSDIEGRQRSPNGWTVGAYEFGSSTPPPSSPFHPADNSPQDNMISQDEVTNFGSCWKRSCDPNATVDNVTWAGQLWVGGANGQYKFNPALACPACWEGVTNK